MSYWESVLLGAIQGLTEFFPVSSSGHLVLAQALLGIHEEGVLLEVLLHVATLLVVLTYYRSDVAALLRPRFAPAINRERLLLIVGLIPTGIAGVFFKDQLESAYGSPRAVLIALAATGVYLLATRWAGKRGGEITFRIALLIGFAQAIAILPGVSRSGATIATALFLGVARPEAARFSFLLSAPAIAGAALLSVKDGFSATGFAWGPGLLGMLTAGIAGWLAIGLLVRMVVSGRFDRWGYYCIAVAVVGWALLA